MNFLSPTNIKQAFSRFGAQPKRYLGQNFLISPGVIAKIVEAADIAKKDTVLEIGPGLGSLTAELAKRVRRVIAVEKDELMVSILKENIQEFLNVEIVVGDARHFDLSLIKGSYKVVANIPYYLTAPLIRKFLEAKEQPETITLVIQKEVAQRIVAKSPDFNLLAASIQFYGKADLVSLVHRGSFWPQPRVDSAILKIIPGEKRGQELTKSYFNIVKAGFSHPRKQLLNNLSPIFKDRKATEDFLKENGINPKARAETLGLEEWIKLAEACTIQ